MDLGKLKKLLFIFFALGIFSFGIAQEDLWHGKHREIHYAPEGEGFVLKNGEQKFNRALYGTNTGFRVETGDIPEFALYMPGMGGNFKLGIGKEGRSKWITEADNIHTLYTTGKMEYRIRDEILGSTALKIQILALADAEGFILKVDGELSDEVTLFWVFGGASGKKFSRSGDIGADPETVFYLLPEYCRQNEYKILEEENAFLLNYGWDKDNRTNTRSLAGFFPESEVHLANVFQLKDPGSLFNSQADSLPVITGKITELPGDGAYWKIVNSGSVNNTSREDLVVDFRNAVDRTHQIASRVIVNTPNPYINNLGSSLAYAGDAIWEDPAYVHGAVAWRMHLNGWRGGYVADLLGWDERAKRLFTSYGNSQVLEPATGPVVPDTIRNFARQKEEIGTAIFTEGYISRHPEGKLVAHHYDMNLVFIDQMLNHFQWSGDESFVRQMWPVVKRHLRWEKRNFDRDGDGLYDAYAAIWASDALQYSGGGVAYTSAYNYRANKLAVELAEIVGDDPEPYRKEAAKIHSALQRELWVPEKGVFAEYKDLLGNKLLHDNPGIWTIYHTIDKGIPDEVQALQMLNYVDANIPHIPVRAEGLEKRDLYLLSTTNWQPYTWSVNNVALAENLHMALAYWKGGRADEAFKLWESSLIESMYLGASPGGFHQLSFYDAIRGELYRDFADPVGVAARTLVEGLFGIRAEALDDALVIKPGFPKEWENASLTIPDISISFQREGNIDSYKINPQFEEKLNLKLRIKAPTEAVSSIKVNGQEANYTISDESVGYPEVIIDSPYEPEYNITVEWGGKNLETLRLNENFYRGERFSLNSDEAEIKDVLDPQKSLRGINLNRKSVQASVDDGAGNKTVFLKMQQGKMQWWHPLAFEVTPQIEIISSTVEEEVVILKIQNFTEEVITGNLTFDDTRENIRNIKLKPNDVSLIRIPAKMLLPGTNLIGLRTRNGDIRELSFQNWDLKTGRSIELENVDLSQHFNSKVTEIFSNKYLSPRPEAPTLQLPVTGIGNWAYPTIEVNIDDSGLRKKAGRDGKIVTPQGISFRIPSKEDSNNIAFVSQWDNFPQELEIPLSGTASHAYLMMAGSTNPMQSRIQNGEVNVHYTDGSSATLELQNPQNWWPIEQDYYVDGHAFTTDAPKPPRVYFKTGTVTRNFNDFKSIKGFSDFGIEGGAGTILDIPLDPDKRLKSIAIKAVANDVVIGLMGITLTRN